MREQTNGERFEEFMNSLDKHPELESTSSMCEYSGLPPVSSYTSTVKGYPELEGTNALCDDIIKSREISDEEIDNYIDKNFIFNDEGNWQKKYFKAGAAWYREQLRIRNEKK